MRAGKLKVYQHGDKLTPKQQKWIDEYIKTGSYTQATINAGYKTKEPRNIGYQNSVKFKDIVEEVRQKVQEKIEQESIASIEDIYKFWTDTLKDDKVKTTDRLKASELLAKSKGAFVEKREVKVVDTDWFIDE